MFEFEEEKVNLFFEEFDELLVMVDYEEKLLDVVE